MELWFVYSSVIKKYLWSHHISGNILGTGDAGSKENRYQPSSYDDSVDLYGKQT